MAAETGWIRGENGIVLEVDLPLSETFASRVKRGEIVRVNKDGTPWEPAAADTAAPAAGEPDDVAELREAHAVVLAENADLSDEVALLTKQRDDLAAELEQVKAQLAEVTKQRDEAVEDEQAAAAKPSTSSRAKSTK